MPSSDPARDFTPAPARSRWVPVVLCGLALLFLIVGLVGLPLVPIPSKSGDEHQFATFGADFSRWRRHAGWRYTSDSWVYWAGVTACAFGVLAWWKRVRGFTRRYALVGVPAAAVLALGPIAQHLAGFRASNYESHVTFGGKLLVSALIVVGMLLFLYFAQMLRRYLRSASQGVGLSGR